MAENTDNIDILSAAGLTITGSSAPIDPELQKLLAETIKITHERLVQERREKAQNTADYEAFDKQERTRITATPSRVRIPTKVNADSEGNVNGIPGRRRTVFGA